MANQNLFSLFRNKGELALMPGINLNLENLTARLVIGAYQGPHAKRSIIVSVDSNKSPVIGRGDRAYIGSFALDGGGNPILTEFNEAPGTCYVFCRLGLDPNFAVIPQILRIQRESATPNEPPKFVRYGAFPLHAGGLPVEVAGLSLDGPEAEELWSKNIWRSGMHGPLAHFSLWRVPPKAAVLARDITNRIGAVCNIKDTLSLEAADTFHTTFEANFKTKAA